MTTKKYTPAHIANYFLWRAWQENIGITPMKLIKLVYIAYGWNLVINENKLFDEPIVAWKYGPVIPSLYHEFKRFGALPIAKDDYAANFDIETGEMQEVPAIDLSDKDTVNILDAVWVNYKNRSGTSLSRITHDPGSAWFKAYYEKGDNTVLDDEDIKRRALTAINELIKKSTPNND
jgi:uncharacterized phage-associated protein